MPKTYDRERIVFSTNGIRKTGYLHAKQSEIVFLPHTIHKINTKSIKVLNITPGNVKLLGEKKKENLLDIVPGSCFFFVLDITPKAQAKKQM